jgi:hypothetical protein
MMRNAERFVYREGRKQADVDPIWAEKDWDALHHRHRDLLPITARCETCAHWARELAGACGITLDLGMVELKRAEDRCTCWSSHIDYEGLIAWAEREWAGDVRMTRCGHGRRGA